MITFDKLAKAVADRSKEWDTDLSKTSLWRANEMGGEGGEALEALLAHLQMNVAIGKAQNVVKKIVREREGLAGSRSTKAALGKELADVVICAARVADAEGIDLGVEVWSKFNEDSDKLGLQTKILGYGG